MGESGIEQYVNAIEYSYNVSPQIYRVDEDSVRQVHPDSSFTSMGLGSGTSSSSMMSSMMSTNVFYEMPTVERCVILRLGAGRRIIMNVSLFLRLREVLATSCPMSWDSGTSPNWIRWWTAFLSMKRTWETPQDDQSYSYDDFIGVTFKLVNAADYYEYDDRYNVWTDKRDDTEYMKQLVDRWPKISPL